MGTDALDCSRRIPYSYNGGVQHAVDALQVFFNMQTDTGTNQKSLASAVNYFEIENTLKAHDALNDAYYTAMIAKRLDIEKGIAEYPGAKCSLCGSDYCYMVNRKEKDFMALCHNIWNSYGVCHCFAYYAGSRTYGL